MHRVRRLTLLAFMLASILPCSAFASYPPVSLSRTQWFWSSTPLYDMGDSATTASVPITPLVATHSRLQWYNARGVQEHDLNPILKAEEGGDA